MKHIQVVRTEGVALVMQVRKWPWGVVRTLVGREDLSVLVQEDRSEDVWTIFQYRQDILRSLDVAKGNRRNAVATDQRGHCPEPLDHLVPLFEGVVGTNHCEGYQKEQTARAGNADAQLRPDREVTKARHQISVHLRGRGPIAIMVIRRRAWPPEAAVS